MMYWGHGFGLWGLLMMAVTVAFWGLVIVGIVLLVRHLGGGGQSTSAPAGQPPVGYGPAGHAPPPAAQQILAERYAKGEIDEQEYRRRLQVLAGTDSNP